MWTGQFDLEQVTRHAITAQHLVNLCEFRHIEIGNKVLVIAPAGHWRGVGEAPGIAYFMSNKGAREKALNHVVPLIQTLYPDMLLARLYKQSVWTENPPTVAVDRPNVLKLGMQLGVG